MVRELPMSTPNPPRDALSRPLGDLRISVTDRCNFRCRYCMPRESVGDSIRFLPRKEILDLEEIARVVRAATALGVQKVRISGGEPLLRKDLDRLVAFIAPTPNLDLALTTNGSLLAEHADRLAQAGLGRVTVSLDALDPDVFRRMCDTDTVPTDVLAGIEAAAHAGLHPIKVNTVVKRGVNDSEILPIAEHFRRTGVVVRFIEYMDVGTANGWRLADVVPAAEILARIRARHDVEPVDARYPGEVAARYRYTDGAGEVGLITSVTRPFCSTCTRARLSAVGVLYTCLFAADGTDLRAPLRAGADDGELAELVSGVWQGRGDRYSERRTAATSALPKVEMHHIGG
jgi:GTP 3',8-cyclase